jgi:hypothetical protein
VVFSVPPPHRVIVTGSLAAEIAFVLSLAVVGCRTARQEPLRAINDRIEVGSVIYTVFDAEWRDSLPGGKYPKNKYLVIRLSMTNSGGRPVDVPLLELLNEKGEASPELLEIEGLDEWLGLLRSIDPAQSEVGRIVFDVPAGSYRLRLTDGGEVDMERTALVEIPYRLPGAP